MRHANTDEINSTNPLTTMTDYDQTAMLEEQLGRATPLDAQAAAAADPYETYDTEELMHSVDVHKPVAPCRPTSPCMAADEAGDGLPGPGWVLLSSCDTPWKINIYLVGRPTWLGPSHVSSLTMKCAVCGHTRAHTRKYFMS